MSETFMVPEVFKDNGYCVEDNHHSLTYLPYWVVGPINSAVDFADYMEFGEPVDYVELASKWWARMTAPGYLDCTDWSCHDTEEEAWEYLRENDMSHEDGTIIHGYEEYFTFWKMLTDKEREEYFEEDTNAEATEE